MSKSGLKKKQRSLFLVVFPFFLFSTRSSLLFHHPNLVVLALSAPLLLNITLHIGCPRLNQHHVKVFVSESVKRVLRDEKM